MKNNEGSYDQYQNGWMSNASIGKLPSLFFISHSSVTHFISGQHVIESYFSTRVDSHFFLLIVFFLRIWHLKQTKVNQSTKMLQRSLSTPVLRGRGEAMRRGRIKKKKRKKRAKIQTKKKGKKEMLTEKEKMKRRNWKVLKGRIWTVYCRGSRVAWAVTLLINWL